MDAWHNGNQFISLLERKQDVLKGNIFRIESRIIQIQEEINRYQQEQGYINEQIKLLTPSGIVERADIYKGIRRQGALLSHLQMVVHKVTLLEDEQHKHKKLLQNHRVAMHVLDKKHYKLTRYITKKRREFYRRRDNRSENEIQEVAVYDRKKL